MSDRVEKLSGHVIICGYGRIGLMLAHDLAAAGTALIVLERNADRLAEAEAAGHLVLAGDATEEESLVRAGVTRARLLATVLPDDAANVFITLSARSLSPHIEIIARGEVPSTESKLRQAGANHVVLPTHISAERIARMVLYPKGGAGDWHPELSDVAHDFGRLGLAIEKLTVVEGSPMDGLTVAAGERNGGGTLFIVAITRDGQEPTVRPAADQVMRAGDVVTIVTRPGTGAPSLFSA
jgi:voltage-gated potassium channel